MAQARHNGSAAPRGKAARPPRSHTAPTGAVDTLYRATTRLVGVPIEAAIGALAVGIVAERNARSALRSAGSRATLGVLDALLERLLADDALDLMIERIEVAEVPERVADRMLDDGIAQRVATRVIEGPELERMLVEALSSEQMQGALARALEHEAVGHLLERLVASPGNERLVSLLIDSPLPEEIVRQLLETEALWVFVDEIARSPSVTEAIAHQGAGFVDEIADKARDRSRSADQWVQRIARRVGRRGDRPPGAPLPDIQAP